MGESNLLTLVESTNEIGSKTSWKEKLRNWFLGGVVHTLNKKEIDFFISSLFLFYLPDVKTKKKPTFLCYYFLINYFLILFLIFFPNLFLTLLPVLLYISFLYTQTWSAGKAVLALNKGLQRSVDHEQLYSVYFCFVLLLLLFVLFTLLPLLCFWIRNYFFYCLSALIFLKFVFVVHLTV